MKGIEVRILQHNFNGMPKFLAQLTQRGSEITCMDDLMSLYNNVINTKPSKYLLSLPHTTIKRMCYMTIAIVGLSTKAVSQLRTHATRLTFISTSTQYSQYDKRKNNFVIPHNKIRAFNKAYKNIQIEYNNMIDNGIDRDTASYLLPQGLRKALIISGNLDAWQYVLSTRMCKRNTKEVQYICKLIYKEIARICGKEFCVNMEPSCFNSHCKEGKFCCGKPFTEEDLHED